MALDGIYIHSLVKELKSLLTNAKVDKVNQPEKDEIILTIRGDKVNYKLLISASSIYPKIHLTSISKPNPIKAPMFCMVLRKYLTNARILDIKQFDMDRIVIMDFESLDELGFNSVYSLIIEIMGRHSNITLVRSRDNLIMDSIKHITPDINTYRCLYPSIQYVYPPESNKLNPLTFTYEAMCQYIETNDITLDEKYFSKVFTGISSQFSKELFSKYLLSDTSSDNASMEKIYNFTNEAFEPIKSNNFYFASYLENDTVKDFYCLKLDSIKASKINEYSSPSKLIEEFYFQKDKADRLNNKSSDLQRIVNTNLERCTKKIKIYEAMLRECEDKNKFKIFGELLTANIYMLKKGMKEIEVLNYYSETEEYLTIKLDELKSPSENVQQYYKKYNKLKKSEEMSTIQLAEAKEELNYLLSVMTNIKNADTYEEIEEIREELKLTNYIKFKKGAKQKVKGSKPLHFISSDGIDIYVGKNNIQNDYLTLKFADKHDIWLHTKNIPGSHVIIKNTGNIPDKTLEEASILASFYSKAKDSSKVPVDYTEVKNVKKPSGAKPGMVIYYTNKTIYADPYDIQLQSAK